MLFSLMSCEEKCPRVENKDLERCILEYDSIVKSKNDSPYILEVYVKNLNDSVKRFEVSYTMNIYFLSYRTDFHLRIDMSCQQAYPCKT